MKTILLVLVAAISSPFANACCDHIETDFNKSVSELLKYSPDNTLIIEGEVEDLRNKFASQPIEMDIRVRKVLNGQWHRDVLTAKRGFRSSNATFEKYKKGKRYIMAFTQETDDDGSILLTQSKCGTYSKVLK